MLSDISEKQKRTKPFLKWAGNKHRILHNILQHLPSGYRLLEPFVGSGAVFLNTNYREYVLGDANHILILMYSLLKAEGHSFIKYCARYFNVKNNCAETYYQFREEFNRTKNLRKKAALFLYLNRHGYNGLCRFNQQGHFNVPFGLYTQPYFPKEPMLNFHEKSQQAYFLNEDFITTMELAEKGDVIYCDPPYIPLSDTAKFTAYYQTQFDMNCQQRLADQARKLARKGIVVIISNHDLPITRKLYGDAKIISFPAPRLISRNAHTRNSVQELLAIFSK